METPDTLSLRRRLTRIWDASRLGLILLVGVIGTLLGISISSLQQGSGLALELGEVAAQDILAPSPITYESEVLTEEARLAAESAVPDLFDPPDSAITRAQLDRLANFLDRIDTIRADEAASPDEQRAALLALPEVHLSEAAAQALLDLTATRWQVMRREALNVLEQAMHGEIREGQVDLARRALPAMVSVDLSMEQADLVVEVVSAFVAPNALYDPEATRLARDQARESIAPVSRSFALGETIVRRGQVIGELELEALQRFGLLEPPSRLTDLLVDGLMVAVLGAGVTLYAHRTYPEFVGSLRLVSLTAALFVITAVGMGFAIPNRTILPYLFPAAMLPMLMAILVGPGMGVMAALVLGSLGGLFAQYGLELSLYYMLSGVMGALTIGRGERLSIFVWAGLAADAAALAVMVAFRFPDPATDALGKASLVGAALASGLFSASLVFALLVLIGNLLGITTHLQLIELSRPDHPLLQQLLRSAPGTYQHSLQVANLAEQAARAIGANTLLTRVGALYHDVGKSLHPEFFIENQLSGHNIHEQLDPATSASMILSHVKDGLELARKHRLPKVVADFIPEHHGKMLTSYQFHAAREAAGPNTEAIDPRAFSYPGPRPRSKETAILMLADGVEAKIRADMPEDEAGLDQAVSWVIQDRLASGQLARTDLTLKDLDTIRRSFVATLRSIYHPRIRYPAQEAEPQPGPTPLPLTLPEEPGDGLAAHEAEGRIAPAGGRRER